jgi:hypothetical protein
MKDNKLFGVMDLKERYRQDAQFRAMADLLFAHMLQNNTQPYEVRDAAFIAELMYREKVCVPLWRIYEDDIVSSTLHGIAPVDSPVKYGVND